MQTRASRRRAAMASSSAPSSSAAQGSLGLPPHGWLLALPGPAHPALVALLEAADRRSLRLVCKDATVLVDSFTTRMQRSALHLQAMDTASMLQRFPAITELRLIGYDSISATGVPEQLANRAPWPSISSLTMPAWPMHAVARVLPTFSKVAQLSLLGNYGGTQQDIQPLCQLLPHLVSLQLCWSQQLDDQQLQTVAALTGLTALDAVLGSVTQAGWAVLKGLQRLRSLRITWRDEEEIGAEADLRGMAALTHLKWTGTVEGEPWKGRRLQLPAASLISLRLEGLPNMPAMPAMPQLTSLVLTEQTIGQELAALAAKCPQLARLVLCELNLSPECHGAPLVALTQLVVFDTVSEVAGVRYAKVFPQLRSLALRDAGPVTHAAGWRRFSGLSALTYLDVSSGHATAEDFGSVDPIELAAGDFRTLAKLPALHTLRLQATHEYVQRISLLTQLRSLEWQVWPSPPSSAFLNSAAAPPPLVAAISLDMGWEEQTMRGAQAGVAAAIAWLAQAPALREVFWTAWRMPCCFVSTVLSGLAGTPSIKRIVFTTSVEYISELNTNIAQLLSSAGAGVDVVLLSDHRR